MLHIILVSPIYDGDACFLQFIDNRFNLGTEMLFTVSILFVRAVTDMQSIQLQSLHAFNLLPDTFLVFQHGIATTVAGPHRHQAQLFITILRKGFILFIQSTQTACSRTGSGGYQAAQNCYFLHNIFLQKITCRRL